MYDLQCKSMTVILYIIFPVIVLSWVVKSMSWKAIQHSNVSIPDTGKKQIQNNKCQLLYILKVKDKTRQALEWKRKSNSPLICIWMCYCVSQFLQNLDVHDQNKLFPSKYSSVNESCRLYKWYILITIKNQ